MVIVCSASSMSKASSCPLHTHRLEVGPSLCCTTQPFLSICDACIQYSVTPSNRPDSYSLAGLPNLFLPLILPWSASFKVYQCISWYRLCPIYANQCCCYALSVDCAALLDDRSFAILLFQEDACDGIILNMHFFRFYSELSVTKAVEFLYHYQNLTVCRNK